MSEKPQIVIEEKGSKCLFCGKPTDQAIGFSGQGHVYCCDDCLKIYNNGDLGKAVSDRLTQRAVPNSYFVPR